MITTNTPQTYNTVGYYTIVQYCPDRSRAECANVGVILLVPSLSYLNGVEDISNSRVRRFFSREISDWKQFDITKQTFFNSIVKDKAYFRTLSDLERCVDVGSSKFKLIQPRTCKVDKPPFLVLNELFDELIKEKEDANETSSDSTDSSNPLPA